MTPTIPDLALYVTEETKLQYNTYRITAKVVTIGPTPDQPLLASYRVRNIQDELIRGLHLNNLTIVGCGYESTSRRFSYYDPIAYMDVYAVRQLQAERMSKTLATISQRMRKYDERFGPPASYGAYLSRVGQAIGAFSMVFIECPSPSGSSSYDEIIHRTLNLGNAVAAVDGMTQRWINASIPVTR